MSKPLQLYLSVLGVCRLSAGQPVYFMIPNADESLKDSADHHAMPKHLPHLVRIHNVSVQVRSTNCEVKVFNLLTKCDVPKLLMQGMHVVRKTFH